MAVLVATLMCALGANAQEAYACYTSENKTLTFYCDNNRRSRTGTTYDLNTGENHPGWKTDGTNKNVTRVVFNFSFAAARPTTTYGWFNEMTNLQSITGLNYLNTSEVTNMDWMFAFCNELSSIDLSHFNTAKVTSMNSMFAACQFLTSLDLSSFNTSKVTNMYQLFSGDWNLETIYVGDGWSTAAVTFSEVMFHDCVSLVGGQGTAYSSSNPTDATYAHIDGSPSNPGYFTEKVPEAYACYTSENTTLTFYYDTQRDSRPGTTYDLNTGTDKPGWSIDKDGTYKNVTKVVFDSSFADARPTTTYDWFYNMENLESITGMENLNTSEVTNMGWMFHRCISLASVDVSHFNTSKVTSMQSMFVDCLMLKSLDLSSFNTAKVTNMGNMFNTCTHLRTIYVGDGWSTAALKSSINMFNHCSFLKGGQGTAYSSSNPTDATYAHIDGDTNNPGYFTDGATREVYACYTPSNTTLTFYYDTQRNSREGTKYNLNTGKTDTDWDTDGTNASVTQVVFDSSFASARPTTTYDWFYFMKNLESITGMEYLNTSEVTDMTHMFESCIKLTNIDVSHFNTSKVTGMSKLFDGCSSLTSLDLSSFNTSKVAYMNLMFSGCTKLHTIYVGDGWSTAAVIQSNDMFDGCTSLVGGHGTTYDDNYIGKEYAHIDEGPSNPGYFTDVVTGIATHIEAVPAKATTVKGIYTLDGRKLNELPTQKGIYIIDGRQVVIQ